MELHQQLLALAQVIFIDLVLAGDNAIIVGMAASRVAPQMRLKVIMWGVAGAVVLRIAFAAIAMQLLAIVGLTLAGGLLLLWVCWKMYREVRRHQLEPAFAGAASALGSAPPMTFWAAISHIIIADVSMSLDNVLAVAGAAKGEIWVLVVGLTFAVIFMAVVASYIAWLLARYPWIMWLGLLVILHVAVEMIWSGTHQIGCQFVHQSVCDRGFVATIAELLRA
jgi:YjbE family integral membrane protein